jgi:carbon storage regulator CsrA
MDGTIETEKGVSNMLVLTRKNREAVVVSDSDGLEQVLKVTVLDIRPGRVTLGIEGERDIPVYRDELWESKFAREEARRIAPGERSARRSRQGRARRAVLAK